MTAADASAFAAPEPASQDWIDLACRLADIARPIAQRHFRQPLEIVAKADESPVTIADRAIEAAMREEIEAVFPDHGIFGEEYGQIRTDADIVWVLDPIDGTQSFISGVPLFGTLIAVCQGGRPAVGVIDQPILEERWLGAAGRTTTFQNQPVSTSGCEDPAEAALFSTHPDMFKARGLEAPFAQLAEAVKRTRYGIDCYAYGLVAAGWADLVVETNLQPYDFCAIAPVIEGAGGAVSDWAGAPLSITSEGSVVAAATPALNVAARGLLTHG